MRPIAIREREYRQSLLRIERNAVIPAKVFVLVVSAGLWVALQSQAPAPPLVAVFGLYLLSILLEGAIVYLGSPPSGTIRPISFVSYGADVAYVSALIYFDTATNYLGDTAHSNFYILCFLLIMRGFALFRSMVGAILINVLISLMFVLTVRLQNTSFAFITDPEFAVQLILIWLVILMAWFIMMVFNEQKTDLIRVQDQLMRSEQLARIGEIAAGVAHEINNPLGVILTTTDYLERTMAPDAEHRDEIRAIRRESERCKEIVRQLMTYARPKPQETTLISPKDINEEVLQFAFMKGQGVAVEIAREYADGLPPMRADANLVKQALLNLYLNARQAIEQGGKAGGGTIRVRIYPSRRKRHVFFEIEDDGPGIAPEDYERIFEPFFTRREAGTGLGLAMTQRIVESFGGRIAIEPAKRGGTVARLRFPASRE
jgi:signal transduction histidine kinase